MKRLAEEKYLADLRLAEEICVAEAKRLAAEQQCLADAKQQSLAQAFADDEKERQKHLAEQNRLQILAKQHARDQQLANNKQKRLEANAEYRAKVRNRRLASLITDEAESNGTKMVRHIVEVSAATPSAKTRQLMGENDVIEFMPILMEGQLDVWEGIDVWEDEETHALERMDENM